MSLNPFGSIPVPRKGRTNFDLSHSLSGSFSLADVQPVFMTQDVIPGDSFRIKVHNLTKLETLISPAMQAVNASLLWFKVPKRLVFNRYKEWYSGGADGDTDAVKPHFNLQQILTDIQSQVNPSVATAVQQQVTAKFFGPGTLWNYFGLPSFTKYNYSTHQWEPIPILSIDPSVLDDEDAWIDAMPFIAYWLIHDEFFMDQTLGDRMFVKESDLSINPDIHYICKVEYTGGSVVLFDIRNYTAPVADGGELETKAFVLLDRMFKRAWQKEYFTSALPTPQRGPEVKIGLIDEDEVPVTIDQAQHVYLTNAPVDGMEFQFSGSDSIEADVNIMTSGSVAAPASTLYDASEGRNIIGLRGSLIKEGDASFTPASSGLSGTADLSGLSPITIAAFRNLFKLQAFLEKNNVAGGRYIETILAHWGERVPDFTVQRPVHVRSTSIPVQVMEVTAMANSSGLNSQLGDQAGRAKAMGNLGNLSIYCQEASIIFGLYCVTVPPAYASQGIDRQWQRVTRFDEPWRDFQHIGEQAIKNREIYLNLSSSYPNYNHGDFGYQQRFSEFKYMPNRIVGDFQTSLAYWTMARMFASPVYLNEDFVTCDPDERIFAVESSRPVLADFYFDIKCKRKLSRFSTPKLT